MTRPSAALPPSHVSCASTHCVTCADEGVPMTVVEAGHDGLASCAQAGERREVMTGLVGPVRPGDVLLVHAGTALAVLPPHGAEAS